MSARDVILNRVHNATATATAPDPGSLRRSRSDRLEGPARTALIDLFVERVEDYRAVVERCSAR